MSRKKTKEPTAPTLKEQFIHELALYLCDKQAEKSIWLQMGKPEAQQWSRLLGLTPIRGWSSVEEGEKILREWLLGPEAK